MQDSRNSRRRSGRHSTGGAHKERKSRSSSADDVRVSDDREEKSSESTSALDHQATNKKSRSSRKLSSSSSKRQSGRLSRSPHSKRHHTNDSKKHSSRRTRSSSADNVRLVEDGKGNASGAWSLSLDETDEKNRSGSSRKPNSKNRDSKSVERSERSSHHNKRKTQKKTRSLSVDDAPLSTLDEAADAWPLLLSLDKNKNTGKGGRDISLDESIQESVKSSRSSRRGGGGRRKHRVRSMPVNSSPNSSTDVIDAPEPLMAETVNEENEANRERMRDLEVQNNQIQEHMQGTMLKHKKGKNDGQDTASSGGRKITIRQVIGAAVIYLAGVGTGYLISELRQRKALPPAKENIYVTQSPTAAVLASNDPTTAPTEFSYDDPAPEDCFAIEAKEEVNGQDGMITRSYDVHFDVQLKDSSTGWYDQLQEVVTDKVIPDLACCKGAPMGERLLVIKESAPMELSIRGEHIAMNRMLRNIR